jgi:hypothetical protein
MFKTFVEQNLKKERIKENSCDTNCSDDVGFNDVRELNCQLVLNVQFCDVGSVHLCILSSSSKLFKYLFILSERIES